MDFSTAYSRLKDFADQFANPSAGIPKTAQPNDKVAETTTVEDAVMDYAVKEENYIGDFLDNKLVRTCLKSIADKYYGSQIAVIRNEGMLLTNESYPMLYSTYAHCCHTLKIKNERMRRLSRRVAISLATREQAFILGHELGHHQQGNLVGHTVNGLVNSLKDKSEIFGPMIQDAIEVPLKRWCRRSEYNADRAGLLCCKDIEVVKQLFLKIGMIESVTVYHQYKETSDDHPMLTTRLKELNDYATSI